MAKDEYLHYRTEKETKEKLKEMAKKENRTPTNWINDKIKKEYEKQKKK